jgi:hypothetical protein
MNKRGRIDLASFQVEGALEAVFCTCTGCGNQPAGASPEYDRMHLHPVPKRQICGTTQTIVSRERTNGSVHCHSDFHGAQQETLFVPDAYTDLRRPAPRQVIMPDLGRCAGGLVFGNLQALIVEAYAIAGEIVSYRDVEIEPGQ